MTSQVKIRHAHKIVEDIAKGYTPTLNDIKILRSCLPEPPKQKTLQEIITHVDDAWAGAGGNDWGGNSYDPEVTLEYWLLELHAQLQGLQGHQTAPDSSPKPAPGLPDGMRLADHEEYGRVVTSPKPNRDGVYDLLVPRPKFETGADWEYAHECELTFIDAEPAKPAHPEFLETEADYREAPVGTIVAKDNHRPAWKPNEHWFINNNPFDNREMAGGLNSAPSRVLRWGYGNE